MNSFFSAWNLVFLCFFLLQVLDIYTTYTILRRGGKELNPVLAWLFGKFGLLPSLIVEKSLMVAIVVGCQHGGVPLPMWLMIAMVLGYVYVVAHNFIQIKSGGDA